MPCQHPPPYPPGPPPPPPPPTQGNPPVGGSNRGEGGQQVRPPPATGLTAHGLSDSTLHAFKASLQVMVADGVSAETPSPALSAPTGKVATMSLLHLCLAYGVAVDG